MSVWWKAAIGCLTGMVLAMFFTAMMLLMLRDWIKPRRDLGLESQHWLWALLPALLVVWSVWLMVKSSAILDAMPKR